MQERLRTQTACPEGSAGKLKGKDVKVSLSTAPSFSASHLLACPRRPA